MPKTLTRMYAALSKAIGFLPSVPRNLLVTLLFLCIAYVVSSILLYLLPLWLEIDGVWWAMVLTEGIVAVMTLCCVKSSNNKMKAELVLMREEAVS